jgi:hypothetical protein
MQLEDFFSLILPDEGVRFAVINANIHKAATTNEELKRTVQATVAQKDIYFACAVFKAASYVDDEGKLRYRTQSNVLAAKSVWLDIDVDSSSTKKYSSQADALLALESFCTTTGFPLPLRISSGYGIHCYWPLSTAVNPTQWSQIAGKMRGLYAQHGLKVDHSRDADIVSILRPPGTTNWKRKDTPRPVEVIAAHTAVLSPLEFVALIQKNFVGSTPIKNTNPSINEDLCLPPLEYPPGDIDAILEQCAQMRHFRDTGGDDYNSWRAAAGVLRYIDNGNALYLQWSERHANYSKPEAQLKWDTWDHGPATCEYFASDNNRCTGCVHKGRLKSPIQIHNAEIEVEVETDAGIETVVRHAPPYPYRFKEGKTEICSKGAEGEPTWGAFFDFMLYPEDRIDDGTGVITQHWVVEYPTTRGTQRREFDIAAKTIGCRGKELHGHLAQFEIIFRRAQLVQAEDYMVAFTTWLREHREVSKTYKHYGWFNEEEFLIGKTLYTAKGAHKANTSGPIREGSNSLVCAGADPAKWSEFIDKMYNYPDHEQYQFIMYAGFGSALVQFLGEDSGCPYIMSGEKGKGKTTVAMMALSIYGNPEKMMSAWKTGTSVLAALKQCANMHSLPVLFDEFSNAKDDTVSDAAYAFANGKPKRALKPNGEEREVGDPWRLTTFITTNQSLYEKLSGFKDDASAELSRMMEIQWKDITALEQSDMLKLLREQSKHYGAAASVYIPYIVANKARIIELLDTMKAKIDAKLKLDRSFRFWSLMLATTMVGGLIATELKLLKFDWLKVFKFALDLGKQHMHQLPSNMMTPLESFHTMLTFHSGQIIVTRTEGDGRGVREEARTIGPPIARVLMDKGLMYISINAVKDWCKSRAISFPKMQRAVEGEGFMLDVAVRYYLGRGTVIQTGQQSCWLLNWNLLNGGSGDVLNRVNLTLLHTGNKITL